MGDIGPQRAQFEVLSQRGTARSPGMRLPEPSPIPVPDPEPMPDPGPVPAPEPVPHPPSLSTRQPLPGLSTR
jgi:hypothetical protein